MEENWDTLLRDGKCIDNENCRLEKPECGISAYRRYFRPKPGADATDATRFFETFVNALDNDIKRCREKHLSPGDKNMIPRAFSTALKSLDTHKNKVHSEQPCALEYLKRFEIKKRIDFVIANGTDKPIFIEFKAYLTNNSFGEAFFEAMLAKGEYEKFYIVTFFCQDSLSKLANEPQFRDHVAILSLDKPGDVERLIKTITTK
ncbi:MAG: hypothetical protein WCK75_07505 [Elusimicrobiota bacterium]